MIGEIQAIPVGDGGISGRVSEPQWHNASLQRGANRGDAANRAASAATCLTDCGIDMQEKKGNTTVTNDNSGKPKEYSNNNYSLAKHDDNQWYFNQKGSNTFVKVDGHSIKMDDDGKVTYNESGLLGKDNQVLGNGSTGICSAIESGASHIGHAIVDHPLDTLNKLALIPIAALDAIAGTHGIKAIEQIEKGAANEVIHHPGEILKDAAIGVGVGALTAATVAAGGGALAAIEIGAAVMAAAELVKNKGNLGGMARDMKGLGSTFVNWGKDFAAVAGRNQLSPQQEEAAESGLQRLGAFGADTAAGIAGGIVGAGSFAAGSRALSRMERQLPDYPATDAERLLRNTRLDQLNDELPNGPFKNTMIPDMKSSAVDNVDIWHGSHVRLDGEGDFPADSGAFYDKWSKLPGVTSRISSHPHKPGSIQYEIPTGDKNSVVLFGLDPKGNTFFQLEHNAATGSLAAHMKDFALYKLLKENIGAEGASPHTDAHPVD